MAVQSRRFSARAALGLTTLGIALFLASCQRSQPDLPPRPLLERAWAHFRLEEFPEAKADFTAALAHLPPGDNDRLNATYGLALIASLADHGTASAEARRLFEHVIAEDQSPTREMAAWSALALVRDAALPATADAPVDRPALVAGYTKILKEYPASPAAEDAFLYRTELLVETLTPADAAQAIAEIRAYLTAHPAARLRTAMLALQSTAHQTRGEYRDALTAAIESVNAKESDATNPRQNNILEYYRIAMMAQFDVGDFVIARAYYQKFLTEYPRDQRAFAVKLLLEHIDRTEAALREGRPVPELSDLVHSSIERASVRSTGFRLPPVPTAMPGDLTAVLPAAALRTLEAP